MELDTGFAEFDVGKGYPQNCLDSEIELLTESQLWWGEAAGSGC